MESTPHDREMLLREMHHRVKNNLQMVSSLLNLQVAHSSSKSPTEVLQASQDRISSMSLLHEKLCASDNFKTLDIKNYVESIAEHLVVSQNRARKILRCQLDVKEFSADVLVPLGLIVNEILSNSLKHGRSEDYESIIEIRGTKEKDFYHMSIRDNGGGFDFENGIKKDALGLKLVKGLANQIGATVNYSNLNGSNFGFSIPIKK